MVIFTTAYPQYAVEGFELNAVDYLVKPFSFDRFWKAVLKAKAIAEVETESPGPSSGEGPDYFFIKADSKLVKINYEDILFVEALQNYVSVKTKEKKVHYLPDFQAVEDHLPTLRF